MMLSVQFLDIPHSRKISAIILSVSNISIFEYLQYKICFYVAAGRIDFFYYSKLGLIEILYNVEPIMCI